MKSFILSVLAVSLLAFAPQNTFGQAAYARGKTTGAILKVGAGGVLDECTTSTATSTAAAATINADSGKVTTESLTTAGLATYTFTLTNNKIAATSKVFVSFESTSAGSPVVGGVAPGSGTCVIKIYNAHATVAFNNTFKISFFVVK